MNALTMWPCRWWWSLALLVVVMLLPQPIYTQDPGPDEGKALGVVQFDPPTLLQVQDGTKHQVIWLTNYTGIVEAVEVYMETELESEVTWFGDVIEGAPDVTNKNDTIDLSGVTYHGYVNISALFVGYNTLYVTLYDEANTTVAEGVMEMSVILSYQNITNIFTILLAVILGFVYFFMGATIDLKVVKGIAKKPIGPLVGLFCQYVLMPLISFGIGQVLFPDNDFKSQLLRLGLFLGGSCPGGGASNMWTVLLGGSLDLSIMMTAVSTIFAFAALPLWVLTMAPLIINSATFVIPYGDITITVVSLLVPCGLGVTLQIFFPKVVPYCEKVVTPLSALSILLTFTFGIYAYLYIFTLFTWRMLVSGFCMPMLGYITGMLLALLFRMPRDRVIAISVETGIQNYNVAIVILTLTLTQPAGQLAAAMPGASVLFTSPILMVMLVVKKIYERITKGNKLDITDPSTLKAVLKGTSNITAGASEDKEKNGKMSHEVGIDNPAADIKE